MSLFQSVIADARTQSPLSEASVDYLGKSGMKMPGGQNSESTLGNSTLDFMATVSNPQIAFEQNQSNLLNKKESLPHQINDLVTESIVVLGSNIEPHPPLKNPVELLLPVFNPQSHIENNVQDYRENNSKEEVASATGSEVITHKESAVNTENLLSFQTQQSQRQETVHSEYQDIHKPVSDIELARAAGTEANNRLKIFNEHNMVENNLIPSAEKAIRSKQFADNSDTQQVISSLAAEQFSRTKERLQKAKHIHESNEQNIEKPDSFKELPVRTNAYPDTSQYSLNQKKEKFSDKDVGNKKSITNDIPLVSGNVKASTQDYFAPDLPMNSAVSQEVVKQAIVSASSIKQVVAPEQQTEASRVQDLKHPVSKSSSTTKQIKTELITQDNSSTPTKMTKKYLEKKSITQTVQISQIDVFIETASQPRSKSTRSAASTDMASRNYLRRL